MKKSKTGAIALGVAFVWFTTHFGGGFASGAQIYSYFVRYGAWCILMPVLAMAYNGVFFAYSRGLPESTKPMTTAPTTTPFTANTPPSSPTSLSCCTCA